ncbi:MAG: hypothetical protein AAFR58_20595 [Cyanobacteria bacterium J06627_28]
MKLTAKQQERLKRPRPFLFLIIIGFFSLPWALLLTTGINARYQRARMDKQAAIFFSQLPTHPRNLSAKQFDLLAAEFSFAPNDPTHLDIQFSEENANAYRAIELLLSEFLRKQAATPSGILEDIPPELKQYLDSYSTQLRAIQTHLLEQPIPEWDLTYEYMVDPYYPFPGFFNIRSVQELLLLSALDSHHQQKPAEMAATLEASWRLNQTLLQRPDLNAQLSVSTVADYQAGLLRHFNDVPEIWINRLEQQQQQQSVIAAHTFETWLLYTIQQHSLRATVYQAEPTAPLGDKLQSTIIYWFSPTYIMQLKAIDTAQSTHRALEQLSGLDVCTTTQQAAEQQLSQEKTADWNQTRIGAPQLLARRWKVTGDRALNLELTQKVLQAKQHLREHGTWPEELPELTSTICENARWISTYNADEGTLSLSLDKPPLPTIYNLGLDPGHPIPFEYTSNQSTAR